MNRETIYQMLELSQQYNAPGIEIELEIRTIIPAYLVEHLNYETIEIPYYRSTNHPSLTIRTLDGKINTKELVEKITVDNISIALSIEKNYSRFPDSLIPTLNRTIKRTIIHNNPYTVVSYYNGAYFLEIEYNNINIDSAINILSHYQHNYWPTKKPIDAYTTEIIVKLMSEQYYLSPKADGEHALLLLYTKSEKVKWMCLFDNGSYIGDILNKYNIVYEGEWMGDYLLCYDTLMYNDKDVRNKPLEKRLEYRSTQYCKSKEIIHIKKYNNFIDTYNKLKNVNYITDGWILSPSKYNDTIYKSKPIPTVDLQYIDGYLYLANELHSKRIPNINSEGLENGKIYEFTLDMKPLRIREDKIIPNYRMPVDIDPISNIYNCYGLPLLRFHHNYVKLQLLKLCSSEALIDVGSGYGGDISKWLKCNYNRIYAVDPQLQLRTTNSKITHLRCELQNIPNNVKYDTISIFFVPWNDEFLKYLIKANNVLLILMTDPKKVKHKEAIIDIKSNIVNIQFPNTVTANNIIEQKVNLNKINKYMTEHNYTHTQIKCSMLWGSKVEQKIASMYTYHMYQKL